MWYYSFTRKHNNTWKSFMHIEICLFVWIFLHHELPHTELIVIKKPDYWSKTRSLVKTQWHEVTNHTNQDVNMMVVKLTCKSRHQINSHKILFVKWLSLHTFCSWFQLLEQNTNVTSQWITYWFNKSYRYQRKRLRLVQNPCIVY